MKLRTTITHNRLCCSLGALTVLCAVFALNPAQAQPAPDDEAAGPPSAAQEMEDELAGPGPGEQRPQRGMRRHRSAGRVDREGAPRRMRGEAAMGSRMGRFLRLVKEYEESVAKPNRALTMAVFGIKQHYKQQGKPLEAIPLLEETLKTTNSQEARNVLLFAIRQVYEEQRDRNQVLAVNKRIIAENSAPKH